MTKLQIVKESIESYWDDETIEQAWNDCCDSLGTPGAKYSLDKLAKFIIKEGADNYEPFDDEELEEAFIDQYFEDCDYSDEICDILEERIENAGLDMLKEDWAALAKNLKTHFRSAEKFKRLLSDREGESLSFDGLTFSGEYGKGEVHAIRLTEEGYVEICYGDSGYIDGLPLNDLSIEFMHDCMIHYKG